MLKRRLGRSGVQVSGLGLGTNGIGGPATYPAAWGERTLGYGPVDEREAICALRCAVDMGVTFFDTADEYGCGQSERLLGEALGRRREDVVIATKFGYTFDSQRRQITGRDVSPGYIRRACEASLRRLGSDYIDVYLLHLRDLPLAEAQQVRETLETLVAEGKIRAYGWSTDDVERAGFFAEGEHCTAVEHRLNVLLDNPPMLDLCVEAELASVNRIPLLMGILTGKYEGAAPRLADDDIRSIFFRGEGVLRDVQRVEVLREVLTSDGRSLVQGALGWIWARHAYTIPIPGFKTVAQVEENAGALRYGPLSSAQMRQVDEILDVWD